MSANIREACFRWAQFAVLTCLVSFPCFASDWMIIGTEPEPAPNRSVYVLQSGSEWISRRLSDDFDQASASKSGDVLAELKAKTVYAVTVLQVFESKDDPSFTQVNHLNYQLEFKCQSGMVSIPVVTAWGRKGELEKGGSPEWMKVPNNWIAKAEMVACGWKNWLDASALPKGPAQAERFKALGVQHLGDLSSWVAVVDAVWNTQWTDATQPGYYVGTPEESAALQQKSLALLSQGKSMLAEQEKWANIAIALSDKAQRLGDKFALDMDGVGGMTEAQVVARWGAPQSAIQTGAVRTLTYQFDQARYGVNTVTVDLIGATGNIVGQTTQNELTTESVGCQRTFRLEEGGALERAFRVFDFSIGCN